MFEEAGAELRIEDALGRQGAGGVGVRGLVQLVDGGLEDQFQVGGEVAAVGEGGGAGVVLG